MNLDRFYKLQNKLEVFNFEVNFKNLSKTLYYFSFLGNIFSILFSYFFIKNITDSIPELFSFQKTFFAFFIILFMVGFELFKRFSFEQLTTSILRSANKFTSGILLGFTTVTILVIGSFYLSLNGAHRLIDTTETVETVIEENTNVKVTELEAKHKDRVDRLNRDIDSYQERINVIMNPAEGRALYKSERQTIKNWEEEIGKLRAAIKEEDTNLEEKTAKIEAKSGETSINKKSKIDENSQTFALMVSFLEFIILIGVAFKAYYEWTSYSEMKELLTKPQFSQIDLNLKLLKIFYQNGRKREQDPILSKDKLTSLTYNAKINCTKKDIDSFITLCSELEIITGVRKRKIYNVPYEKAKVLLENREVF